MRSVLHALALKIFQFCAVHGVELEVQWIPRTKIGRADYISRTIDVGDWQITAACFKEKLVGVTHWIVLLAIIIRRSTRFSLGFATQAVVG